MSKKKLDELTKAKLIYSGELWLIAIVFLVISILELTGILNISERHQTIFNWVTIFGGTWTIADLIWALASKKRQKRICLLDKILTAPLGAYLIAFDLISFFGGDHPYSFYQIGMPIAFLYIVVLYTFEGFYHWKYPIPGLIEASKEDEEKHDVNTEESKNNEQ